MAEENIDEMIENLSGTEKSAILMMLLGEDEAAQVLQKLTPRSLASRNWRCTPLPEWINHS